jgi:hypothetical protein
MCYLNKNYPGSPRSSAIRLDLKLKIRMDEHGSICTETWMDNAQIQGSITPINKDGKSGCSNQSVKARQPALSDYRISLPPAAENHKK